MTPGFIISLNFSWKPKNWFKGEGVDKKNYTEFHIILLLAIPYLIDFLTGVVTFYLATLVLRLEEDRNPHKKEVID